MHKLFPTAEIAEPRTPEQGVELARELARRHETIVAVGGDGTVNSVVNGIAGSGAVLGIIPTGTGNVLAAAAGIPMNKPELAAAICRGDTENAVDLGVCEGRRFVASLGFGFDAAVVRLSERWKLTLGCGAFALAAMALQFTERPSHVAVHLDGNAVFEGEALLCAVINAPRYGGFLLASKATSISDGLLDLAIVLPARRWPRSGILLPMLLGTFRSADSLHRVTVFRGRRYEFTIDPPPLCQIDGELWDTASRTVSVEPKALRMKTASGILC
jgi:YegS/Rv2252/BmrU family lipid kinase